jgi:hypothetical protein
VARPLIGQATIPWQLEDLAFLLRNCHTSTKLKIRMRSDRVAELSELHDG